jgi:tRNA pseudouridine38-40 synthase
LRYFIEISYNGKNYFGWQTQPNQISVQQTIENAVSIILRTKITITGAGRTDTGVHAIQTFAHFDFTEMLPNNFLFKLNQFLPKDIAIASIKNVKSNAHARFNAISRTYTYFIITQKNPFSQETQWQLTHDELDLEKMNQAALFLLEVKDFSSFAKLHSDNKTNLCEVSLAKWEKSKMEYTFTITANRFLRNMVRAIVGTLVEVGKGNINLQEFKDTIQKKDRKFASHTAPAKGLFLYNITYPNEIYL